MEAPADFVRAYDALLARWPGRVEPLAVPTPYGPTRVNRYGDDGKPPLVLLPGGGATSGVWFAVAGELARTHQLYAVDLMGDAGLSPNTGAPLHRPDDLNRWLDAVLDHCGLAAVALCGHSYGGWIAMTYAEHAPNRVTRLALLDPTGCFARFSARYLLHALPLLLRATPARVRRLYEWEARGGPLDEAWLAVTDHGTALPGRRIVTGPRPQLAARSAATLVLLPERSRVHNIDVVEAVAREQGCRVVRLPGVSHHQVPVERPAATASALSVFLA